jgi:hypothetical protein
LVTLTVTQSSVVNGDAMQCRGVMRLAASPRLGVGDRTAPRRGKRNQISNLTRALA